MRRLLLALCLLAATPASASATLLSPADAASFSKLEARLGGTIGLAAVPAGRGGGAPEQLGGLSTGVAWSTSKTAIAMAIYAGGKAGAHASDLREAITASDNDAALRLWAALGSGTRAADAANTQLRAAGDETTMYQSRTLRSGYTPFGQTRWDLADQATFTAGMRCVSAGRAVLRLMGETIPSQRWGLGAVGRSAQLKGGWGPGSVPGRSGGYLDRQMGILTIAGKPIAVTIASLPSDGTHGTGTRNLTAIARWFVAHVDVSAVPATPSC